MALFKANARPDVHVHETYRPHIEQETRKASYIEQRDLVRPAATESRDGITSLDRVVNAIALAGDVLASNVYNHLSDSNVLLGHRDLNAKMHQGARQMARKYGGWLSPVPIKSDYAHSGALHRNGRPLGMQDKLVVARHVPIMFDAAEALTKATVGNLDDQGKNDFRVFIDTNSDSLPPSAVYMFGVGEGDPAVKQGNWQPLHAAYEAGVSAFDEVYVSGYEIDVAYQAAHIAVSDSVGVPL